MQRMAQTRLTCSMLDVFRFTLYWTLVFYTPLYILCGTYAFLNLAFPPFHTRLKPRKPKAIRADSGPSYRSVEGRDDIPMRRYDRQLGPGTQSQVPAPSRSRAKQNETRSRLTFALLVLFVFALAALAGAVVGSAIIGYVMAGLFKASKYNMSTCVPCNSLPLPLAELTALLAGFRSSEGCCRRLWDFLGT